MSRRKPKQHEIIAEVIEARHLRADYEAYLKEAGRADDYAAADVFAGRATGAGTRKAYGMTEREIIIKLAGRIDSTYD